MMNLKGYGQDQHEEALEVALSAALEQMLRTTPCTVASAMVGLCVSSAEFLEHFASAQAVSLLRALADCLESPGEEADTRFSAAQTAFFDAADVFLASVRKSKQ